ncbi:MAG: helix-turn-helix domain-containing protein, partial [Thermoleophilia bacterium]
MMAARHAQRRLAALNPKGPGPAMVLLAIIAEVSSYSRMNDTLGVDRIAEVSGMDRRTVQRALKYLEAHDVIVRVVTPTE